mmetsp:Transcript_18125/g.58563  ORF Transcript_18125/g.58563 Transcript_18125/m.58563 type:complete len:220 (+) Transcript_18125:447-1106(+)
MGSRDDAEVTPMSLRAETTWPFVIFAIGTGWFCLSTAPVKGKLSGISFSRASAFLRDSIVSSCLLARASASSRKTHFATVISRATRPEMTNREGSSMTSTLPFFVTVFVADLAVAVTAFLTRTRRCWASLPTSSSEPKMSGMWYVAVSCASRPMIRYRSSMPRSRLSRQACCSLMLSTVEMLCFLTLSASLPWMYSMITPTSFGRFSSTLRRRSRRRLS